MIEKGSKVRYIGETNGAYENGKTYVVYGYDSELDAYAVMSDLDEIYAVGEDDLEEIEDLLNGMAEKVAEAERKVNALEFELSLLEKVELVVDADGTKRAINGEYRDDKYRPMLIVKGYNEKNKRDEEYKIYCYSYISDWTLDDYIRAGKTPAFSFPHGVKNGIICTICDLRKDLEYAREKLMAEKHNAEMQRDLATYYLLGDSLVGKREPNDDDVDFLFMDGHWTVDDEKIVAKLLDGEDLTEHSFNSFLPAVVELINDINVIDRDQAMQRITRQTISYLLNVWAERFAAEKTEWDRNPKTYAKLVSIDFVMNGIKNTIYPKDFPFEDGPADDAFIEHYSEEICDDLRKYGAFVTGVYGMSD